MKKHYLLATKLIMIAAMLLAQSCTFKVEIPPIKVMTEAPPAVEKYDMSEAFKSVGMLALQPIGDASQPIGLGTAFAVNKNTLLSAGHVCTSIRRILNSGNVTKDIWLIYLDRNDNLAKKSGAKIKSIDASNDICQLEFKNHNLKPLKFANYKGVKFGDKTFIVGAPSGVMISITEGNVMNKRTEGLREPEANNKLALSSAATGGHSGSPILNERGELIGILLAGHKTYDHLTFGVPVSIVNRFMKKVGIKI